jgi:hypothetical protein
MWSQRARRMHDGQLRSQRRWMRDEGRLAKTDAFRQCDCCDRYSAGRSYSGRPRRPDRLTPRTATAMARCRARRHGPTRRRGGASCPSSRWRRRRSSCGPKQSWHRRLLLTCRDVEQSAGGSPGWTRRRRTHVDLRFWPLPTLRPRFFCWSTACKRFEVGQRRALEVGRPAQLRWMTDRCTRSTGGRIACTGRAALSPPTPDDT